MYRLVYYLFTDGGVSLHDVELILGELAGLIKDRIRDTDLAYIV